MKKDTMDSKTHRLESILAELKEIYSDPARSYHNMDHINGMLDRLKESSSINTYRIELVIWFHDAVYNTRATDNEIKSAELWMKKMPLFLEEEPLEWGKRAILATIDHLANNDPDIQLLLDLDLAPLGAPYEAFTATTDAIRNEYGYVPFDVFHFGRRAFYTKMLKRKHIFGTQFWYDRLEIQARSNMERELND